MFRSVCSACSFYLVPHTMFLSNGKIYWATIPQDKALFKAACQNLDTGFGEGIYGCPSMQKALQPWIFPNPVASAAALTPALHNKIADAQPVSVSASSASLSAQLNMQKIMEQFQSLGDNCELGLIQRWADAEPLDLLRFAGFAIPIEDRLQQTIKALADGFSGLGAPESVICELHGQNHPRQFMVRETRWQLLYHTESYDGDIDPEVLRLQQVKALQFRRRKLLEDLKSAHRIFVWKSNLPTAEADVRALVTCIQHYGPNLLLWVSTADQDHPAGLVEYGGEGLLKGYVSRFAPYGAAGDIEFSSRHAVCQNAVVAANFLRRSGEWSSLDPNVPPVAKPIEMPLGEMPLEEAASATHWEEWRSEVLTVGPVFIGASFRDMRNKEWFQQNPGSQNIISAELPDIVMDSACSVLLQGGRKIRDTRYLLDEEGYRRAQPILQGLRFDKTDKVAIVGFNRAYKNFYHWMAQSLPAIDLSVSRLGAERSALVLLSLSSWQEETLLMLGLGDIPRIPVNLSHHYHFPQAYFCDLLNGHTSFSLSCRSLEIFNKLGASIEPSRNGHDLIYVARLDTSNRPVTNEKEVQRLLSTYGFVSVIPGSMSVHDQISVFKRARIVVGPHGAGLTNIAFCKPGTIVLELVQSSYANPCFNRIAQAHHLEYHAECFESTIGEDVHRQPWNVDISQLSAKLSTMLSVRW